MSDPAGTSFIASEVVDLYPHRPPYPPGMFTRLFERAPVPGRLLDLGCGEGKIARPAAARFREVVAVDPSANMIALGRSLEGGQAQNLHWVQARAEDAVLKGRFDVVTFASSIHWMDPSVLFDRLGPHLGPSHLIAVIRGDEAFEPPWQADWRRFLGEWVPKITGQELDSAAWSASRTRYLDHVDVVEVESFVSEPVAQTVESFILCQQSRESFARSRLGARAEAFRRDLEDLLRPHADAAGRISYSVQTELTLARVRGV